MRTKEQIATEIHRLIDEQFFLLKDTLAGSAATEYFQRKQKIEELLEELGRESVRS